MSINYSNFEKEVYNWLLNKHKIDESFNFSTRKRASKNAERDYFIGTVKSNYFGTTLWSIPVNFPGSSNDLIDFIFLIKDNKYVCFLQFVQTRNPHDTQNILALKFIQELKTEIQKNKIDFWQNNPDNKMEYYDIPIVKGEDNLNILLQEFERALNKIVPVIDNFLLKFKKSNPDFRGERIDKNTFENVFQKKLFERLKKYPEKESNVIQNNTITDDKELDEITNNEDLNLIFYGPPGTGKTYHTINKAIEIIDPVEYEKSKSNRKLLKSIFDENQIENWDAPEGQIAFITFHQSMSYEDFIEGLKPLEPKEDKPVQYDIVDGVFKRICEIAKSNYQNAKAANKNKLNFEEAFSKLKDDIEETPELKFPLKTKGYDFTLIGFTNTSIRFRKSSGGTSHTLSINTLRDLYYGKQFDFKSGVGIYYPSVLNRLNSYSDSEISDAELKNYVLIIDEINRGNVSQIFGELITLIENEKRLGNKEALEVILPYSKEKFSVPPNLYIIGTMNTADRSVEALDTALRRRFIFEEMMPKPELLTSQRMVWKLWWDYEEYSWHSPIFLAAEKELYELLGFPDDKNKENYKESIWSRMDSEGINEEQIKYLDDIDFTGGIDLKQLLDTINNRIEVLLNRDNLIGHSYLMNVQSIDQLKQTFYKNIIPLLQEYFYGDYGKIGLVLGSGFVKIKIDEKAKVNFADFKYEQADDLQKMVYEIVPEDKIDIKDAIAKLLNIKATTPKANEE